MKKNIKIIRYKLNALRRNNVYTSSNSSPILNCCRLVVPLGLTPAIKQPISLRSRCPANASPMLSLFRLTFWRTMLPKCPYRFFSFSTEINWKWYLLQFCFLFMFSLNLDRCILKTENTKNSILFSNNTKLFHWKKKRANYVPLEKQCLQKLKFLRIKQMETPTQNLYSSLEILCSKHYVGALMFLFSLFLVASSNENVFTYF